MGLARRDRGTGDGRVRRVPGLPHARVRQHEGRLGAPPGHLDFGVPWQRQTRTIGKALGRERRADALVKGVESRFAAARKAHPEFASSTGLMATPYDGFFVHGSQDPRSRVLTSLGFTLPGALDKVVGGKFGANISRERADLLDQDAVVWLAADPEADRARLHRDSPYGRLGVARQDHDIYVKESGDYGNAISSVSVPSLPYVLDRLVPQLAAALGGEDHKGQETPAQS